MHSRTRRRFLRAAAGAVATAAGATRLLPAAEPAADGAITLGFSLYGMKSLKTEAAIRVVAEIGFDSVELCLLPGWDAVPNRLGQDRRKEIRSLLDGTGLKLPGLMELVSLAGTPKDQQIVQERLKRGAELGHQLNPGSPPLIETTTGSGNFDKLRNQLRDHLAGWARVAKAAQTVVAIKPHRFGVINRPDQAIWLLEQVNSRWIKLNYDYSHFAHRDISLAESIRVMMPQTRFIHVKDTVLQDGKARFVLPGESGQIDYVQLLKLVHQAGYRGDVCCEVSGMIFGKKNYDPMAAAKTCYGNLAAAFKRAEIPR